MMLTLLAILVLPISLKLVLDPKGSHKAMKEWDKSPGMQFFSSITLFILAMLLYLTSSMKFAFEWENLLTWIAALTAVKGVGCLVPALVDWRYKIMTEKRTPFFGFLGLLFALFLVFVDTQLLG